MTGRRRPLGQGASRAIERRVERVHHGRDEEGRRSAHAHEARLESRVEDRIPALRTDLPIGVEERDELRVPEHARLLIAAPEALGDDLAVDHHKRSDRLLALLEPMPCELERTVHEPLVRHSATLAEAA